MKVINDPFLTPLPIMHVNNLHVSYGAETALRISHLDVFTPSIMAIVGPSGCGKSTLLNTFNRMCDLVPECKVRGKVEFAGQDIFGSTVNLRSLRRRIGMIFQKPNPFPLSIWQNLDLPLKHHGVWQKSDRQQKIEQALKSVGLWPEVNHRLHSAALTLSGGQQQRLCIARSLILEPEVLLMDEPCSALDPKAARVIEDLIIEISRQYAVMVVTHNLGQARRIATYTAVLGRDDHGGGRLLESGPTEQVFSQPQDRQTAAYLAEGLYL